MVTTMGQASLAMAKALDDNAIRTPDASSCHVVALGHERAGLYSSNAVLQDRVMAAAEATGEKFWPMPLDEEYKEQLKSPIADLPNIGTRWGGSITAAMFLKQFADPLPWVHLDIAGTAWLEGDKPVMPTGPTGMSVRTFVELALKS